MLIKGMLLCLIAAVSWGAMFPVAHHSLQYIDPFYFSFIRYAVVGVLLSILLYFKEGKSAFRLEGRGLKLMFLGAMAFTVYNMGVFWGQQHLGESGTILASIMEVFMPVIAIIIMWVYSKKVPAKKTIFNIIIAFIGAFLVITKGDLAFFQLGSSQILPLLSIFMGVIGWVIYSLGGHSFKGWSVLRYSTLTCLLGTAVSFVIIATATGTGAISIPSMETLNIVKYDMAFMILLPGLAALLSWNKGLQLLSSTHGVIFINFVPITTFVIMAVQGYYISQFEIIGSIVIMAAVMRNTFSGLHWKKFIVLPLHHWVSSK